MLVLAGAGSGKTRVLVHRVAWLMMKEGMSPHSILAVTFTNKAAQEMRGRIETMLEIPARTLWIGTFHGLAHRLLRRHAREAGLSETFQILDADDQHRLIRRLLKSLQLDEARWPPRQVQWYINSHKDAGRRPAGLQASREPFEQQLQRLYLAYEETCNRLNLLDFGELLLRTYELFKENVPLLDHYRQRFRHVLVDEFQDTNKVQYAWLRLLTNYDQNLFAVGDDDQSIYSWRGARAENLQKFQADYPRHRLVRLEQNYRSTGHILNAANALIAQNVNRLGKTLWTDTGQGSPIALYSAFNEQDEARFVVDRLHEWTEQGERLADAAILYRSNAQSRQFEEKLTARGVPYRVYGGLRFFERAEIKDALGYLRVLSNRDDDPAFERVVNTPARGIGTKTLDLIRALARAEACSLWQAATLLCRDRALPARSHLPLANFLHFMEELASATRDAPLADRFQRVIAASGLREHYQTQKEKGGLTEDRLENLNELINAARQFENEPTVESDLSLLDQFLAHAALESGDTQGGDGQDCVQLMTLHSAKGLEFEQVFIVGLEEGLFPCLQSLEDPGRLEEERRLCYVGLTRARRELYLSHAETRRIYGRENYPRPSRFLREIPPEHLRELRPRAATTTRLAPPRAETRTVAQIPALALGQRVRHPRFGEGVVLRSEGRGHQAIVEVNFEESGIKWLVLAQANLAIL